VTSLVATVVLARARRGMTNKVRLANAAIVAVEKQRKHQPSMACITYWCEEADNATHEILSGSARSGLGCGSEVRAETNLLINKGVEESD
jgi:hypothetical protein